MLHSIDKMVDLHKVSPDMFPNDSRVLIVYKSTKVAIEYTKSNNLSYLP